MTKWIRKLISDSRPENKSVPESSGQVLRRPITHEEKKTIERAVERTVEEYGKTLEKLAND